MAAMANPSTSVDYERGQRPDKTARPANETTTRRRSRSGAARGGAGRCRTAVAGLCGGRRVPAAAGPGGPPSTRTRDQPAVHRCDRGLSQSARGRSTRATGWQFRVTPRESSSTTSGSAPARSSSRSSSAGCTAPTWRRSTSTAAPRRATCHDSAPKSLRCDDLVKSKTTLAELLAEHGSHDRAAPGPSARMLEVGRRRRAPLATWSSTSGAAVPLAAGGPASYLYPPDKGWVRLDPPRASTPSRSSISRSSSTTRAKSRRCSCGSPTTRRRAESREGALQQKFSDVATLFAGARSASGARHVLEAGARGARSGTERRTESARRTILPGCSTAAPTARSSATFPNRGPRRIAVPADGSRNRGARTADDRAGSPRLRRSAARRCAVDGGAAARAEPRGRCGRRETAIDRTRAG